MAGKRNTYRKRRASRKRKSTPQARAVGTVLFVIAAITIAITCVGKWMRSEETERYTSGRTESECLMRVTIPDETPEIWLEYTGFNVSFNPSHHVPNYAAWELTAGKADGTLKRDSRFRPDPDVYGCPTLDDYRNSGFDRGHMAPAGDMKWDARAMADSHLLTNMCPQDHSLNGGRWATLETKCREWARRDSALVIICGPILTDRLPRAIGESGVSVPERFFKVIITPYTIPPRAIGFVMSNSPQTEGLESMAMSVDQVEEITGYDFFPCMPDEIENRIEGECNYRVWNRRKK